MTDQTSNHEPEDVVHDADPDAVNVESVNDGESVPGEQAQTDAAGPAGLHVKDAVGALAIQEVAQVRAEVVGGAGEVHA